MNRILLAGLATLIMSVSLRGQGFVNLDFQSAQIIFADPPYNHVIATTNALPYWSAFDGTGTNSLSFINYNHSAFISPVTLYSYSYTNGGSLSINYSVLLDLGSISQTALVPADAQSLFFKSKPNSGITVSLGGQDLSYMAISNALDYTLYGAAIPSSFAGQTQTLTFMASVNGGGPLDDIQFSPEAVPEPPAISFFCLGTGILFYVRRRKRQRRLEGEGMKGPDIDTGDLKE